MENPKVEAERSSVPDWARQESSPGTATQVANEAVSGKPKVSERQRSYILDLLEKKQIPPKDEGNVDLIYKCLRISEDPEEYGMSKDYASKIITWLLKLKDKPRESKAAWGAYPQVPAGRYAVDSNEGELRFYHVWRPKDNPGIFRLYVLHGPESSPVHFNAQLAIMEKIAADVRGAAIRFGLEIGSCSNCGRRLTNRISRELGIGPICGGRMFGDDFKSMEHQKRNEITARGEDPNEELD